MPKVTPWLWFDTESEQAAELYTSVFPNSRILDVTRYADFAGLDRYCYRVAGVVGLMMTHVFGYRSDRCLPNALALACPGWRGGGARTPSRPGSSAPRSAARPDGSPIPAPVPARRCPRARSPRPGGR